MVRVHPRDDVAIVATDGGSCPGARLADGLVLQVAAGMNMHVLTTGRGTPYNLSPVPVIKVSTRRDPARRWHDLIDLDAATIGEMGRALFRLLLETASGERETSAERLKLANSLVLFNPAPVT